MDDKGTKLHRLLLQECYLWAYSFVPLVCLFYLEMYMYCAWLFKLIYFCFIQFAASKITK